VLVPDELLQIPAKCELGLVWQIAECSHQVDHAVSIPSDVIELLNLVHATAPALPIATLSPVVFNQNAVKGTVVPVHHATLVPMSPKHPPGPPMTLANMREQGVHHLIAFCLW
jgi:hypothetical protein